MKSFQESLLRTEIDAGTRLVEVRRATNHILTGGRSRSYDKKKKTSLDQQRYLTPMFIIRDAIHAIEKVVPTRVHTLLDLGAGDAMLGSAFVKTRGVRRAISIETNPVWKRAATADATRKERVTLSSAGLQRNHLAQLWDLTPYGFRSKLAKDFVRKAYDSGCAYSVWLLPQVLRDRLSSNTTIHCTRKTTTGSNCSSPLTEHNYGTPRTLSGCVLQ